MSDSDSRPRVAAAAAGAFKAGSSHPACRSAVAAAGGGNRSRTAASYKRNKEFISCRQSHQSVVRDDIISSPPDPDRPTGVQVYRGEKTAWLQILKKASADERKVCLLCFSFSFFELRGGAVAAGASGRIPPTPPSPHLLWTAPEAEAGISSVNKILCGNMWAESVESVRRPRPAHKAAAVVC